MASDADSKTMDIDAATDRKRKQDGASSGVSSDLKKHFSATSDPDFELGTISEIDLPTHYMIMNCVADCFTDETFIKRISPTLVKMSQPLTNTAINDAVAKAVLKLENDVIKPLQKQNDILTKAISKKDETIQQKDDIIKAKDELLKQRDTTIINLEQNVQILANKLDDLEQYGRRSPLRMFNVPLTPGESCTYAALKVMNELMKVPVNENDIERCHVLGRPNAKGNRPIIVKFKSYSSKAAVFSAKNKLKGNPAKIFVTEDLTRKNHSIIQKLVELRKNDTIDSFWTNDCKISVKVYEFSVPARVSSLNDVENLLPKYPA